MRLTTGKFCARDTPIYPGSNFTWGEATKKLTRVPEDLIIDGRLVCSREGIERNIINTAKYLDEMRKLLGNRPIIVTSWYRGVQENKRCGGAKKSQHLYGLAVDFYSQYFPPAKVYKELDAWHGNKGGLGKYYSFTHIDLRGYKARW